MKAKTFYRMKGASRIVLASLATYTGCLMATSDHVASIDGARYNFVLGSTFVSLSLPVMVDGAVDILRGTRNYFELRTRRFFSEGEERNELQQEIEEMLASREMEFAELRLADRKASDGGRSIVDSIYYFL